MGSLVRPGTISCLAVGAIFCLVANVLFAAGLFSPLSPSLSLPSISSYSLPSMSSWSLPSMSSWSLPTMSSWSLPLPSMSSWSLPSMSSLLLLTSLSSMSSSMSSLLSQPPLQDLNYMAAWVLAQWIPIPDVRASLMARSWAYWEQSTSLSFYQKALEEMPSPMIREVNVQEFVAGNPDRSLLDYLQDKYGPNWRRQPLLLRNLWTKQQLQDPTRRVSSAQGLLKLTNLTIPYFVDSTRSEAYALSPDGKGTVADIVANITGLNLPHKIGTQFIVEQQPELIAEIAPPILTQLFGDYFKPENVQGSGPWNVFPALTTVPLFVASGRAPATSSIPSSSEEDHQQEQQQRPFTALHCEPIGNIAVQLSGAKHWTLVDPIFSFLLRPSTAPDGRAFFASLKDLKDKEKKENNWNHIPTYTATTYPGDAMWVPTWMWHRVDYQQQVQPLPEQAHDKGGEHALSIGGSLFHFRPRDFVVNNPLFAILIVPAMILEAIGYNTQ